MNDIDIITTSETIGKQVEAEDGIGNAISFIDKMSLSFPYPWPIKK